MAIFRNFCRCFVCALFALCCVCSAAWADYPFSVKTADLNPGDVFVFTISAKGSFDVDCGTGGTLSGTGVNGTAIDRSLITTNDTYTCTYSSGGSKIVRFDGTATGYNYDDGNGIPVPAIKFISYGVEEVYGDLTAVFGGVQNCYAQCYPPFVRTFEYADITQIPGTLFASIDNYYGDYMFYNTFYNCAYLQSVPEGLFDSVTGGGAHMFDSTFAYCSRLESIPSNLFANISSVAPYMFYQTFSGDYELNYTGVPNGENYLSPTLFYRLFEQSPHPDATDLMTDIFDAGFNLAYECPENYYQYITGYESYWNGVVSCLPCPLGTHSAAGSTSISQCLCDNILETEPDVYLLDSPESTSGINLGLAGTAGSEASLPVAFNYGTVYLDSICSVTPGVTDVFGFPDTTQTGPYCWCRVTQFDPAGGGSVQFGENDSYWVFLAPNSDCMNGLSCDRECQGLVSKEPSYLLRQSLYTTYQCPVYFEIIYDCNNDTNSHPNINNGDSDSDIVLAGETVVVPESSLNCNVPNGFSLTGWYCSYSGEEENDVTLSVVSPWSLSNLAVHEHNVFGDASHPEAPLSGSFEIEHNTLCKAILQHDYSCNGGATPREYTLEVLKTDASAEDLSHNGDSVVGGTNDGVVQFHQIVGDASSQMYYQIRFEARASSTAGIMNFAGTPSTNSGNNCWCRVTEYDKDGTGSFQALNNMAYEMPWVFAGIKTGSTSCLTMCDNQFMGSQQFRDVAYTTKSCPQNHTISYNCNGGSGGPLSYTTTNGLNYTLEHSASECGTLTNCYLNINGEHNVSGDAWVCYPNGENPVGSNEFIVSSSGTLPVEENYTCYAQWMCCQAGEVLNSAGNGCEPAPTTYTLTYNVTAPAGAGISTPAADNSATGGTENYPLANVPTATGYTCSSWSCVDSNSDVVTVNSDNQITLMPSYNVTCSTTCSSNIVGLQWLPNGGTLGTNSMPGSCVYNTDDGISGISPNPTKTGYTFNGWLISGWDSVCGANVLQGSQGSDFFAVDWHPLATYGNKSCRNWTYSTTYCGDSVFSDLNLYEFKVVFDYGTVYGVSKCSDNQSASGVTAPSDTSGQYCWCSVNGYTPAFGSQCNLSAELWAESASHDLYNESNCLQNCAFNCARDVMINNGGVMYKLYGITQ